jgi:uncharacterized protein (TIGR03067 family)
MKAPLLGALTLTLTLAAVATAGDDGKKDLAQFQGDWTVAVMEEHGKKAPDDEIKDKRVQIKDDKLTVLEKDKVVLEFRFKLDAAKKPRAIDFTYLTGEDKGTTELGIYEFDGDTVKFCVNEKGKERPKEFTTRPDNELNLVVLKRKK